GEVVFCGLWIRMNSAAEAESRLPNQGRLQKAGSRKVKLHGVDALDVASFGSVDANLITFVDEGRDVDNEPGFEGGRLHDGTGSSLLQGRLGLDDFKIHGVGKIDADGFLLEEFDFDDGIGNQIVDRFA